MPGIHVRSLGRFDWEDQNKESVLTVPGSYWLCHKNNIYKFTFKFHKSIRNSTNFAYSKELMKIIRRVIKWQPKQGQNFSTKNLLVTYNHASWTRQDKTFAIMKFCDRPDAIAFPHAFILTVKILDEEEQSKIEEMGAKATKPEPEKTLNENLAPSNRIPSENPKEDQENVNNIMSTNKQKEKEIIDSKEASRSPRTRSRLKDLSDCPTSTNSATSSPSMQIEATSGDNGNAEVAETSIFEEKVNSSVKITTKSSEIVSEPLVQDMFESSKVSDSEDESDDSQSESASLPYQYLIEKDIERTLENSRLAQLANSQKEEKSDPVLDVTDNLPDSVPISNTASDNVTGASKDRIKFRSRQNSKDSNDSLPPPEVANLKSSNITDLVMKGLMFTIRQDKDTVTVVEQKTKLELDEVLENSEKVETKAGDPCLLNSSLLRLEKMVTRIKEPTRLPEEKGNGLINNPLVTYVDQCDMEKDIEFSQNSEKNFNFKENSAHNVDHLHDQFKNILKSKSSESKSLINVESIRCDKSEKNIKEEENTSDAHSNGIAKSSNRIISGTKVAIDKKSEEQFMDCAADSPGIESSDQLHCTSVMNGINLSKDLTKLPKVISNTIITNDQLPFELQKVLYNKVTGNNLNSTVNTELLQHKHDSVKNDDSITTEKEIKKSFENDIKTLVPHDSTTEDTATTKTRHNENNNFKLDSSIDIVDEFMDTSVEEDELIEPSVEKIDETKKKTESFFRDTSIKQSQKVSTEVSSSDSDTADNFRKTRRASKLLSTTASISSDSGSRLEGQIERRSQRSLDKKPSHQSNKILAQQKRKNNTIVKTVSKVHKSDNGNNGLKDVNIDMNKLLNDLKYGVEIVVERLDEKKIRK